MWAPELLLILSDKQANESGFNAISTELCNYIQCKYTVVMVNSEFC